MPRTVQEQAAEMTRKGMESLLRAVQFVPEEKRSWVPMGDARTPLDMLAECIQMCDVFEGFLTSDEMPQVDRAAHMAIREGLLKQCGDLAEASKMAREGASHLCDVMLAVPNERLDRDFTLPMGGGMVVKGIDLLFMPYWNMTYHVGQLNYIQMLLGDKEMH
jgi:hypothetical protein